MFLRIKTCCFSFRINETVKARSSKYINDHKLTPERFEWQEARLNDVVGQGYGVFSYSQSQVDNVYKYILNQETHHNKQTFRNVYLGFLKKYKVEYDEQYIFQELV